MSANATATTVPPIFQKGDKVKLQPASHVSGRLRCGPGLTEEFPANPTETTLTGAINHDQVFTVFDAYHARVSVAPGQPQGIDPMTGRYRLVIPTTESRHVYEEDGIVKYVLHSQLRYPTGVAIPPQTAFERNQRAVLLQDMTLQPIGAMQPTYYRAGQSVRIKSVALTTKGKPAASTVPPSNCRYEVAILTKRMKQDVYWKASYELGVGDIQAA